MKQLSLMIDLTRCIGCKTCIVACRNFHGLVDHARAMPGEIPSYLRVESARQGTYPDLAVKTWVVPCQHCKNPQCLKSCPSGAIAKDEQTGIVRIDKDKCKGVRACIEACPWSVIQFDRIGNFAHKCDMCFDRVHQGLVPVCAETCLTNAISFGEKELLRQRAEAEGKVVVKKMSPMSVLYVDRPA
jgi:polysulfide reductase chain B